MDISVPKNFSHLGLFKMSHRNGQRESTFKEHLMVHQWKIL